VGSPNSSSRELSFGAVSLRKKNTRGAYTEKRLKENDHQHNRAKTTTYEDRDEVEELKREGEGRARMLKGLGGLEAASDLRKHLEL